MAAINADNERQPTSRGDGPPRLATFVGRKWGEDMVLEEKEIGGTEDEGGVDEDWEARDAASEAAEDNPEEDITKLTTQVHRRVHP